MIKQVTKEDVPLGQALIHGLAHNGMNRPLQELGTIMQNQVTSKSGEVKFDNANYVNGDMALGIDGASIMARVLGSKPLREAVLLDEQYRQKAYDAEDKLKVAEIGTELRLRVQAGEEITRKFMMSSHSSMSVPGILHRVLDFLGQFLVHLQTS